MLERVLVFMASVGPREVQYFLPEKPAEADMVVSTVTPAALIRLQARHYSVAPPTRIIALGTERAYNGRKDIENAFQVDGKRLNVEWVPIPDGGNFDELMDIVQKLLDVIPQRCRLVVDITHGFRPSPFVFSIAIQYLTLLNPEVEIEGLYYGMAKQGEPTAIIDLKVYLDMLDWLYGARVFRDTFIPNQLVEKIDAVAKEIGVDTGDAPLIESLRLFAAATDAALPAEMAASALALRKALAEEVPQPLRARIPVANRLFNTVTEVANEFISASDAEPGRFPDDESDRQALVIDKLLEHGRTVQAVGLMREWCYLQIKRHNPDKLERGVQMLLRSGSIVDAQVRKWFRETIALRNALHHYGTSDAGAIELRDLSTRVNELWSKLRGTDRQRRRWQVSDSSGAETRRRNAPLTSTPMAKVLRKLQSKGESER